MATADQYPILNPYTPLAFLAPSVANATSMYRYVVVGSLSVMIWDLLQSFPEDYRVILRLKFTYQTVVFIISRLSMVSFLSVAAVFGTAELHDCNVFNKTTWALYVIASLSTSLLLYFRLMTRFRKNIIVLSIFAMGLLLVISGGISTIFSTEGDKIGPTESCIMYVTSGLVWLTIMSQFVYDWTISWVLIWSITKNPKEDFVPHKNYLQKIVQDGRLYLSIIALLKIPLLIIFAVLRYQSSTNGAIRLAFLFPDLVLVHILSARIYRDRRIRKAALLPVAKSVSGPGNMSFLQREIDTQGDTIPPLSNALYSSKAAAAAGVQQDISVPPGIKLDKEAMEDNVNGGVIVASTNVVKFGTDIKSDV